jgi:hypothetical protein
VEGHTLVVLVDELGRDLLVGDLIEDRDGARVALRLQLLGGRLRNGCVCQGVSGGWTQNEENVKGQQTLCFMDWTGWRQPPLFRSSSVGYDIDK